MAKEEKPTVSRPFLTVALIAAPVFVIAALWTAIVALHPVPPRTVVMVTGPEGGA